MKHLTRLLKGSLLKPTLNLLSWILKRDANSLIGGGPLGWSWYATLAAMATDHHGDMTAFGSTHHSHSQLSGVTADQHHAQDHAARHASGGADAVSLAASQITSGRFGMARMPDGTSGYVLTAQGAGADPAYAAVAGIPSGLIAMWSGLIANIPSGWVICDGNNGTPNLLTRFVEGVATAATNPGATGGATSKTTSGHQHMLPFWYDDARGRVNQVYGTGSDGNAAFSYWSTTDPEYTTSRLLSKSQTDTISDIRPKYYDIAFIMKT